LSAEDPDDTQELPRPTSPPAAGATLPAELAPGTPVGAYVIREKIAGGGGGTVYVAEAAAGGSAPRVAIKVMLHELAASPLALGRFQREAEVVDLIHHPNIVPVLGSGSLIDGRPYIVMELASTDNLKQLLARRGRLTAAEALEILDPVCSALAAAHAAGVIHRDLKASNISVADEGGPLLVKLLDFGIAKLLHPDPAAPGLTAKGARLGTPLAMAPEQIRGEEVDARTDVYALGVLAFKMLTGSYPFSGPSPQEIERLHLDAAPPRPSQLAPVSPALDQVLLTCLEKSPAARFPSVVDLLAAYRAAIGVAAAPAGDEPSREVVAIHVELADEYDDADDGAHALDLVEQALRQAGFALPLVTGNAILGARVLPADPAGNREARRQALATARGLLQIARAQVSVHAGPAQVAGATDDPDGPRISGGILTRLGDWALTTEIDGVRVTGEAAANVA
jgi:eukaryotic-like serine/threonine-protein kinase